MTDDPRRVLVAVPDLFFATRIAETCRALGITAVPVSPGKLEESLPAEPVMLLADLTARGVIDEIARLKDRGTRTLHVVGFYPHVEESIRQAATAAGVDRVMPRSAFTRQLPAILQSGADPSSRGPASSQNRESPDDSAG